MTRPRKIILYIATSLDGYIARKNGDLDWLPGADGEQVENSDDFGYQEFVDSVDTVLMGNTTYQQVLSFGGEYPYKDKASYVASRSARPADHNVEFISGDLCQFVRDLKQQPGKDIWLVGGAELFSTLYTEGQVDELILFQVPCLIGEGIALFSKELNGNLKLLETVSYANGMVKLHYSM